MQSGGSGNWRQAVSRKREDEPFNSAPNTGRMGFRYDWEPLDDRPCIVYTEPFWAGPEEEARWLRAVRSCPLSEYGHLDVFSYLRAVGEVATGLRGGVKSMPRAGRVRL